MINAPWRIIIALFCKNIEHGIVPFLQSENMLRLLTTHVQLEKLKMIDVAQIKHNPFPTPLQIHLGSKSQPKKLKEKRLLVNKIKREVKRSRYQLLLRFHKNVEKLMNLFQSFCPKERSFKRKEGFSPTGPTNMGKAISRCLSLEFYIRFFQIFSCSFFFSSTLLHLSIVQCK